VELNNPHLPLTPRKECIIMESPQRAVVLAAGRGQRLRPFTDHIPKPLLPVNGRPTLDYIFAALTKAGVEQVCLVTHHLAEQIEAYAQNGHVWDLRVTTCQQTTMRGTADALKVALNFVTTSCYVLAADYVLPSDYLQILKEAYIQGSTPLAVALRPLPEGESSRRSSVRFDENGRILEIVEKPAPGLAPSDIGASLIYIIPPDIRRYLAQPPLSARGEYELPTIINQMIQDGYAITGCLQAPPPEWQPPGIMKP
jgi:bifunctional UDP-N-acetylglucosamine pyrophosphorylase/glucosamine-1-phosphate N-acetyltransferase